MGDKMFQMYRADRIALSGAVVALHEIPSSCSLERDELLGCVFSSLLTITKKPPQVAIHLTEMLLQA